MSRSTSREPCRVGMDVCQARLNGALLPTGKSFIVTNDEEGLDELLSMLKDQCPTLLVLEASGGFERRDARTLTTCGIAVCVRNPTQARDFARVTGRLAKID